MSDAALSDASHIDLSIATGIPAAMLDGSADTAEPFGFPEMFRRIRERANRRSVRRCEASMGGGNARHRRRLRRIYKRAFNNSCYMDGVR